MSIYSALRSKSSLLAAAPVEVEAAAVVVLDDEDPLNHEVIKLTAVPKIDWATPKKALLKSESFKKVLKISPNKPEFQICLLYTSDAADDVYQV